MANDVFAGVAVSSTNTYYSEPISLGPGPVDISDAIAQTTAAGGGTLTFERTSHLEAELGWNTVTRAYAATATAKWVSYKDPDTGSDASVTLTASTPDSFEVLQCPGRFGRFKYVNISGSGVLNCWPTLKPHKAV